jgi:basic membrane protein A
MTKRTLVLGLPLLFMLWSCGGDGTEESPKVPLHVGLVFDVGGLGDKSFNDSAYEGLRRARDELGISFSFFEPGEGSDREAAMRLMAAGQADLVFGVGFLFTDDITVVAREFPEKHFACIDYAIKDEKPLPPNLAAVKFREEEGSFLAGAVAGLLTQTGTVGFVGGMEGALIKKFEAGFAAGVREVEPDAKVLINYAGVTDVQGEGAGAGAVRRGRRHHLSRLGGHGARSVRGGAREGPPGHRRRRRPVG